MNKNIQTFIGCDAEYIPASIALHGVPFDGTASYRPGTRFGPAAIRGESFGIETYSPYCDQDVSDKLVFDAGDLELPFGDPAQVLSMVEERTEAFLRDGKIPLMLGGEHLITLGAIRAMFGRIVIATLIQIGGLGVSSIGVGIVLLAHRRLGLKARLLVKESLNLSSFRGVVVLVRSILLITLCFELSGAALAYISFSRYYPPLKALEISLFHAVSSFNNAGFDILGGMTSLVPFQKDVLLNLLTCGLIFFGGIGFLTILDVLRKRRFHTLNLHSKVVILTSVCLIIVGTLLLKLSENISWMGAFFQSVSSRTAGFNTVDIGKLSNAGLFVLSMRGSPLIAERKAAV